jgi:uncharacterized protein (TIGR02611 family)
MGSAPARRAADQGPLGALRLVAVTVVGSVLLVAGVVALVLPGPGMLLCLLGLVVLSREYAWARRSLRWARVTSQQSVARSSSSRTATVLSELGGLALAVVGLAELVVGLPLLGTVTASLLILSGAVVVATTAWARRQYVRGALSGARSGP